ncbi:MAG: helical backbone metal receptor, partial [Catalinimonas sp.]
DRAGVEALAARGPVWLSDVPDLPAALDMIRALGQVCDRRPDAAHLAERIAAAFGALPSAAGHRPGGPTAAYLIWRDPWMAAGGGTFIHDMMGRAGLRNVFADRPRYPQVDAAALRNARPDLLLLPSEPFPFAAKHLAEVEALVPSARARLVDGELFSWYGSRLLRAAPYLAELRRTWADGPVTG